jgi:DNA-binding response OmpR family regulator
LILSLKRQLGDDKAPPIVALTARTSATDMHLAQKFGCSTFISKPFTPERLVEVVKGFMTLAG